MLGFTNRRKYLIDGLERYLLEWNRHHLLESAIIDGSFVTDMLEPRDIDILLVPKPESLNNKTFAELVQKLCEDRDDTKEHFGCEAFPVEESDSESYLEGIGFFSMDRKGNVRGLLRVNLPL